jgi:hypothetical protein
MAKSCYWRAEKLGQTLKAAKFTRDAISMAATVHLAYICTDVFFLHKKPNRLG